MSNEIDAAVDAATPPNVGMLPEGMAEFISERQRKAIQEYIRLTRADPSADLRERAEAWVLARWEPEDDQERQLAHEYADSLAALLAEVREELVELIREADEVIQGHMIGLNCRGPVMSDDLAKRWRAAIRAGGGA